MDAFSRSSSFLINGAEGEVEQDGYVLVEGDTVESSSKYSTHKVPQGQGLIQALNGLCEFPHEHCWANLKFMLPESCTTKVVGFR